MWPLLGRKDLPEPWSAPFQAGEVDAVTLDAGHVFEAGLAPYNLKPVVAEYYGSEAGQFSRGTQEHSGGPWPPLVDAESCLVKLVEMRC